MVLQWIMTWPLPETFEESFLFRCVPTLGRWNKKMTWLFRLYTRFFLFLASSFIIIIPRIIPISISISGIKKKNCRGKRSHYLSRLFNLLYIKILDDDDYIRVVVVGRRTKLHRIFQPRFYSHYMLIGEALAIVCCLHNNRRSFRPFLRIDGR